MNDILDKSNFRNDIKILEDSIRKQPDCVEGDRSEMPLKHTFGDGIYVRELNIPKGFLVVGKIHKTRTLNILLKGDITILTENGIRRMKAPEYFIGSPGEKKVGFAHEDTVWVNVLPTEETNLDKIEDKFIAKNYQELDKDVIDVDTKLLIERMNNVQQDQV